MISNVIDGRIRAQTSYLLVQSDSVIVEQQRLRGEDSMSAQKQVMDWIDIQWTRLVSEQTWDEANVDEIAWATHRRGNCSPEWFWKLWELPSRMADSRLKEPTWYYCGARRTDVPQDYVVLLLRGRISPNRTTHRSVVLAQPVGPRYPGLNQKRWFSHN